MENQAKDKKDNRAGEPFAESVWMRETDYEIVAKHSLNPNNAVEQLNCSIYTLMDEARKDDRKHERKHFIKILDEIWAEKGEAIDKGLYMYPFEAVRKLIIDKLNEDAEEDEKYKGVKWKI